MLRDDIEIRPLVANDDSGLFEKGRCVGCGDELPSPLNTRIGNPVQPVMIFHNSPGVTCEEDMRGLCPGCMHDVATMVRYLPDSIR